MKYIKLYENRHDFVFDEQRYFPNTALVNGEEEPTYFTDVEEVVFELTVTLPTEKVVTGQTYTLAVEYGGADVFASSTISTTGDVTLNGTQFTANTDGDFSVTATYDGKTVTLNGTSKLMTAAPTIEIGGGNTQYGRFTINVIGQGTKTMTFNGEEYTSNEVIFSKIYYEDLTEQTVVATATAQENGKWESDTVTKTFVVPVAAPLTATISDDTLEDGQTAQITVMYGSYDVTNIPYERTRYTASGDVTCTEEGVVTAAYSTGSGSIVVNYNNLPPITINVTVTEAVPVSPKIVFTDPDVESIITEAYGSNGEITEAQAAAVTTFLSGNSLYNPFYNNTNVDSFDEFSYFTGITAIGTTFRGCSKMASIIIPANVTSIDNYAFERCSSLTSINLPAAVTSIGSYTFSGCSGLTDITIPSGVTSIGNYAFNGCSSIGSATIEGEITSIGDYAFNGCSGMWAIVFLATTPPTIGTGVFNDTNAAFAIYVPKGSVDAYKAALSEYASRIIAIPPQPIVFADPDVKNILVNKFGSDGNITDEQAAAVTTFMSGTNTSTNPFYKNVNVDSFDEFAYFTGISSVGINTFNGCSNMTSITIPENVTYIGERAFDYCYLLGSITIPDSVTYIGRSAFQACTGLTTLNLGSYVETIDIYAFKECSSLTSVNIPDSVTTLGDQAFNSCTNLNTVTIGKSVSAITSAIIPTTISYVSVSSQNNTYDSRDNCNGIIETATNKLILGCKNTVIPSTVTSIGAAFNGCTGLTSITIPSTVTYIGVSAFSGCTGLTSITIPSSVTSIGSSALRGCTGLTSITIPSSVTSIGGSAFYNCTSLTAITCEATTPPTLGNVGFYNTDNCPILVPAASVDAYKTATGWSKYADRIQAIGVYVSLSSNSIVTGETYTLSVKYNGIDVLSNATVTSTGDVTISGSSFTANSDGAFSITATYNGYTATLNGTASTPQYAVVALDCSQLADANPFEHYDNEAHSNAEYLALDFGPDTYVENGVITIPPEDDFGGIVVAVPDPAYDGCIGYIKLTHPSAEYKLNDETTSSVGEGEGYTCDVSFDSTTLTTTFSNFVSEDQESPFTGVLALANCGSTDIKITRIEVAFIPAAEEPAEE